MVVGLQVFITAPNPASGPIPEDVAGTFEGPYYEWFSTEKAKVSAHTLARSCHVCCLSAAAAVSQSSTAKTTCVCTIISVMTEPSTAVWF